MTIKHTWTIKAESRNSSPTTFEVQWEQGGTGHLLGGWNSPVTFRAFSPEVAQDEARRLMGLSGYSVCKG